ncbi:MAG: cupin domain-containing protein [Bacteroidetes bacterium]|nr:cupin domain-containing protein [Bacteroidota bacterium]
MEQKSNDATPQRPLGERNINAATLELEIHAAIQQIISESAWQQSDRNSLTLFKSDRLRIVLIGLHAQAELKTHTANGTLSVQVIKGNMNFTTEGKTHVLSTGKMMVLQPNIPHSVLATTEAFFLLTLAM